MADAMIRVFETVAEGGLIRLPTDVPPTAHCVVTILDADRDTLRKQSQLVLPEAKQQRMSELLLRNREGKLSPDESKELDSLAEEFDTATLAKGSALAALAKMNSKSRHD
jgi:hypothetical protein